MNRKSNETDYKMRDFMIPGKGRAEECQGSAGNAAAASSRD